MKKHTKQKKLAVCFRMRLKHTARAHTHTHTHTHTYTHTARALPHTKHTSMRALCVS